jgi:hypothetical protein
MLRHRRLRQTEMLGQIHHAMLAQRQMPDDRQPGRITEPVEQTGSRAERGLLVDYLGLDTSRRCHRHQAMLSPAWSTLNRPVWSFLPRTASAPGPWAQTGLLIVSGLSAWTEPPERLRDPATTGDRQATNR